MMHIDINSCFAAIEQQANPQLRGRPTVVAAYPTNQGCILAASVEAKRLGIKTGMRVGQAKQISPQIEVLSPDPPKYRYIHSQMIKLFLNYTPQVYPKSIDEAVLVFENIWNSKQTIQETAIKIKRRIKTEIGDWLTVSVGLGPNQFLAKTAASIKKPDGLEEISAQNVAEQLAKLSLTNLCGINQALRLRLNSVGIRTPVEFLRANFSSLQTAFRSVASYHWYLKLRGYEVSSGPSSPKSIGHSYALPQQTTNLRVLGEILQKLCERVGRRLRHSGYEAQGISLHLVYKNWEQDQQSQRLHQPIFASQDIYYYATKILGQRENVKPVRNVAISVFELSPSLYQQQPIFLEDERKRRLSQALDEINDKYGEFTLTFAPLIKVKEKILDRIAFGRTRDLDNRNF